MFCFVLFCFVFVTGFCLLRICFFESSQSARLTNHVADSRGFRRVLPSHRQIRDGWTLRTLAKKSWIGLDSIQAIPS